MADNQRRTAEELSLPEYNYYIVFQIPPTEKNATKIETIIKQKKNGWTAGSPLQRRYKELYTDIENVMIKDMGYDNATGNYTKPDARAAELAAAKKIKLASATKLVVSMCQNKDRLFKSELEQITQHDTVRWFTVEELEKEIAYLFKQGITYIDNSQTRIDFKKYKDIEGYLKTARKASLYELLGCTPSSSIADLEAANKTVYAAPRNKTSAEGTAIEKLLGLAKTVFKTEASKKEYDNYLALKETVWDQLELRQLHGVTEITTAEFLSYAGTIQKTLKMAIDDVELYLGAALKHFKITVIGENGKNPANLEMCPYPECGKAYRVEKGITACPHCGKPLVIPCWNCGTTMPFTAKSKECPTCHSTPQSKAMFDARAKDLDGKLRQPGVTIDALQTALTGLVGIVPHYKTTPDGNAAKKIAFYEREIADRVKEENTKGVNYRKDMKHVQSLMNGKCYWQAKDAAIKIKKDYGTYNAANTTALLNEIDSELAKAKRCVDSAKIYDAQKNEAMVITYSSSALDVCADYSEAQMLLRKYPPQPPKSVRLTVNTDRGTARLDWDKSNASGATTYTVLKKTDSKPANPNDGAVLEKGTTLDFYEDSNLSAATAYYYGVFAERCGVQSSVVTTPAALIFSDVSNVVQDVDESKIRVRWTTPANVKEIEVWKKKGPDAPSGENDGVKIPTDGLNGFTDTDCADQNSYLILCVYDVRGIRKTSRGIRRTMKKYEKLQKLNNPQVELLGSGNYTVSFDTPPKQQVKLICSKDRLPCRYDTEMQMIEYNAICKGCTTLTHRADVKKNLSFRLAEGQVCWVYPMVYNDQLFMLSKPFLLNNVSGIRNISFTEDNGTVFIKGNLQPETKNIIVKISPIEFPTAVTDFGERLVIPKDRFVTDGGISVKLKANTINYISVFAEIEKDGVKTVTEAVHVGDGAIDHREKVVVHHVLSYKVSAKGSFSVTIEFAANAPVKLPKLCVVKGQPRPMAKNEGELVETIEPPELKKGLFSKQYTGKVKITSGPCPMNTKFVVFPYDESVKYVRLKEVTSL